MYDADNTTSATSYSEIFASRGQIYHQAMQDHPEVRSAEFLSVINEAAIEPGMTVVDVPSGGAYTSRYLPKNTLIGLETSEEFARAASASEHTIAMYEHNQLPLKNSSVDRIISIAGLHHLEDKRSLFCEMSRVIKETGRIVVADVGETSNVRYFLDDFVGRYSETGHSGWYFNSTTKSDLMASGLRVIEDKPLDYLWEAQDRFQLARFCRRLFGMTLTDDETILEGIESRLGMVQLEKTVGMNWQLHCFVCEPIHNENDHHR